MKQYDVPEIRVVSTPASNPPADFMQLYFKSDENLYKKNPSGTETQIGGGGWGGRTTIPQQRVWTDEFTVARTDANTLTYTASTADEATTIANARENKLFRIENGDGSGFFKAWIASATAASTTVTINLNGEEIPASGATSNDSDLSTARVSISRVVEQWELHIPWEQVTDASNPQGKRNVPQGAVFFLSSTATLWTAAAGAGADCQYNVYDDGSALYGTAPSFGTNASLTNQIPTTLAVAGGSIVNIRVLASAGASTKPQDLIVNLYYAPQSVFTLP